MKFMEYVLLIAVVVVIVIGILHLLRLWLPSRFSEK